MFRKNCLMCNSSKLNDIINLGMHPFADTFIPKSKIHLSEKVYPLIVQLCKICGNIQLKCQTEPEERYQDYEYSYTSSNSNYSKNYWLEYSKEILKSFSHTSKLKILEIGSNDGYLLSLLKKLDKYKHSVRLHFSDNLEYITHKYRLHFKDKHNLIEEMDTFIRSIPEEKWHHFYEE